MEKASIDVVKVSVHGRKAAGRPYPLQSRCGHVDEIGHVAVFLASSKASYMTGTDVSVDGGITAAGNWAT